jgi:CDP-paratose 2-epimerase
VRIVRADIRQGGSALRQLMDGADLVIHNAGQVAVTTSVTDPRTDFEINAAGTFEVLEALRASRRRPPLVFSSTNKVYGALEGLRSRRRGRRYVLVDAPYGVAERFPLDFHSPYGCSKGAADQYVRDYARIYDLPTVVFRKSCIYGPRQFGVEDQGWVAWFAIAALLKRDITIFGDGRQVRDVLHVEDLVRAYEAAVRSPDKVAAQAFNVGGGPGSILSLLDLIQMLEEHLKRRIPLLWDEWRPGDQRVYVSDIRRLETVLGWKPEIDAETGIAQLIGWVAQNRTAF